jgi:hypothetical protein
LGAITSSRWVVRRGVCEAYCQPTPFLFFHNKHRFRDWPVLTFIRHLNNGHIWFQKSDFFNSEFFLTVLQRTRMQAREFFLHCFPAFMPLTENVNMIDIFAKRRNHLVGIMRVPPLEEPSEDSSDSLLFCRRTNLASSVSRAKLSVSKE